MNRGVLPKEIDEIVRSCAEDENLRRIVLNIDEMSRISREEFSKKMRTYFSKPANEVERQSLRFFELIVIDDIRGIVISRLEQKGS